ncbi:Uncharacterised protein [Vibrio cholerae]|nr:Uncharacterised protein [Vibrio cholerae]
MNCQAVVFQLRSRWLTNSILSSVYLVLVRRRKAVTHLRCVVLHWVYCVFWLSTATSWIWWI